jgi:hypothetical protein
MSSGETGWFDRTLFYSCSGSLSHVAETPVEPNGCKVPIDGEM